ncbi:hypothetical protein H2200_006001 [Cladophialophora chaetospira]|uniref:Uncharacterized protein n=1 Tax=Cladophialophora chaetospira TaxID=386627 RepID=A0AA39CI50_9EURO|nr:hypothetical protein H2200_006001 [Cladophialophora chaetospira]
MSSTKLQFGPDLQYMLAETLLAHLVSTGNGDDFWDPVVLSTLLSLRLASRHLSTSHKINSVLFEQITFQCTAENLTLLIQTCWTSIGPFVHKINFVPSPHTEEMTLPPFQKLLAILSQHVNEYKLGYGGSVALRRYMRTHWSGRVPTSEIEVLAAFECYKLRAHADDNVILAGFMRRHWVDALRSMPHVTEFNLRSLIRHHPLHFTGADFGIGEENENCFDCHDARCLLRDVSKHSAHGLCTLTIECLTAAGTQITALTIDSELIQDSPLSSPWGRLSLRSLKSLCLTTPGFHEEDSQFQENLEGIKTVLQFMLHECHDSLQELSFYQNSAYQSASYNIGLDLEFPRLERLYIEGLDLPESFAEDLLRFPALQRISLNHCSPGDVEIPDEGWKALFHAVRAPPNPVHLTFDLVYSQDSFEGCFEFNPAKAEENIREWCNVPNNEPEKVLFEFLLDQRPWDETLQRWWEL